MKNEDEVSDDLSVIFGEKREIPFVAKSPVIRSAMSDGSWSLSDSSPEMRSTSSIQHFANTDCVTM